MQIRDLIHSPDGRSTGLSHYRGLAYRFDAICGFGYNPPGQVTSETRDNDAYAWAGHYALSRPYGTNGLNQYTTAGGATFAYDANGNLTGDGSNAFVYDVENRLVSASGAHHARLDYDPLGRLWQVTDTASGAVTRFLYDGDALVAEYDGAGAMTHRYAHWAGADTPMAAFDGAGLSAMHHLFADRQGSIVALAEGNGALTQVNSYDEYGIPAAMNQGRFQYTGQVWLAELGLYYYKARIYSPTLGRFLQTDPVGYADQFNLYAYVGNDPINSWDPSGKQQREVVEYQGGWIRVVIMPLRVIGTGVTNHTIADTQAVASQVHAPAGEPIVHVVVLESVTGNEPGAPTFDVSPGKDYTNYNNGQGEGINPATLTGHMDSTRWDLPGALLHDTTHPGMTGSTAVQDRYTPVLDSSGHTVSSTPNPGYENNIMGTTSGRELNNAQVDAIADTSRTCSKNILDQPMNDGC